jgi:hypothetical protein
MLRLVMMAHYALAYTAEVRRFVAHRSLPGAAQRSDSARAPAPTGLRSCRRECPSVGAVPAPRVSGASYGGDGSRLRLWSARDGKRATARVQALLAFAQREREALGPLRAPFISLAAKHLEVPPCAPRVGADARVARRRGLQVTHSLVEQLCPSELSVQ